MPEPQQEVRIVHEDGRFATVPAGNLAEAEKLGWRVEDRAAAAERQKGTIVENVGTSGLAGLAGGAIALPKAATALGSAALGVDDPLADISGRQFVEDLGALASDDVVQGANETRAMLEANMEARPILSAGSELAGNLVGAAATGGLAGAGAKAGLGALGVGGRALTTGATVLGGAIEGGVLGADMAAEQAWLRDEQATAEQTLASMGLGATLGGGLAAAAPLAARGLGKIFRRRGAQTLDEAAAAAGSRLDDVPGAALTDDVAEAAAPLERVSEKAQGKASSWLSGLSDDSAVAAVARQNQKAMRKIGGRSGDTEKIREVGRLLKEADIVRGARSPAKMLERAEAVAETSGRRVGQAIDTLAEKVPVVSEDVFKRADEVIAKYQTAESKSVRQIGKQLAAEIKNARADAAAGKFDPKRLHSLRGEIDSQQINWGRTGDNMRQEAFEELRWALEDGIQDEMAKLGGDLVNEYKAAKELFRASRWASDTLAERVGVRDPANRFFSLTDHMGMGAGFLAGGGNPIAALGLGAASKFARERGAGIVSEVASKLARESVDVAMAPAGAQGLARNLRALVAASDEKATDRVSDFFRKFDAGEGGSVGRKAHSSATAANFTTGKLSERRKAYRDHAEQIARINSSPEAAAAELAKLTGPNLPGVAPGLHAAMGMTMTRAAQYLSAHQPAPARDPNSLTPHLEPPPPVSEGDLAEYAVRVEGVTDPLSLLDDLARGDVDPLKVEAVKAVWPQVFEGIRTKVFAELTLRSEPVPMAARKVLEIALDAGGTIEPSLAPGFMRVMQEAGDAQEEPSPRPPSGPVPDTSKSLTTRSDRLMQI